MGRKRKRAKEGKDAGHQQDNSATAKAPAQQPYNSCPPDPPSRLVAVHPTKQLIAVAFGKQLAVTILRDGKHELVPGNMEHADVIRAVSFDSTGAWLASADDSKVVKLWRTSDWTCAHTFKTGKKPSAAAFSIDGAFAFAADKFGDVAVASTADGASAPLLGHYCSTVTSLAVSPDGSFIASGDRDNKVRISLLPADPLQGAHDIQSYCLGHTSFLTGAAFVTGEGGECVLATASGDGSVRLWNHLTGEQLACEQLTEQCEAAEPSDAQAAAAAASGDAGNGPSEAPSSAAAQPDAGGVPQQGAAVEAAGASEGAEAAGDSEEDAEAAAEPSCPAIISLAVSPSNRYLAVAIEAENAIQVLRVKPRTGRNCGRLKGTIERHQALTIEKVPLPTSLAFGTSSNVQDQLWVAGGPLQGDGARAIHLGSATLSESQRFEDDAGEPSDGLAAALQSCHLPEGTAEAIQLSNHLRIRPYTQEEMDARKSQRADVVIKNAPGGASCQQVE